jgi:aryl-alcohol dehydrogenase-like predicted oxidoreductase
MGMSLIYGPSNEAESVATLHAAIDAGVNLIDTGRLRSDDRCMSGSGRPHRHGGGL